MSKSRGTADGRVPRCGWGLCLLDAVFIDTEDGDQQRLEKSREISIVQIGYYGGQMGWITPTDSCAAAIEAMIPCSELDLFH